MELEIRTEVLYMLGKNSGSELAWDLAFLLWSLIWSSHWPCPCYDTMADFKLDPPTSPPKCQNRRRVPAVPGFYRHMPAGSGPIRPLSWCASTKPWPSAGQGIWYLLEPYPQPSIKVWSLKELKKQMLFSLIFMTTELCFGYKIKWMSSFKWEAGL